MSFLKRLILTLILSFFIISFTSRNVQQAEAIRPLIMGEQPMREATTLSIEALPKGPVTPPGPSPCTYVPGSGNTGNCRSLNGSMNFAGRNLRSPGSVTAV